jgi:hypothetical protein
MVSFADWFPLLSVGSLFTAFGLLKVYGLNHNIVGGGGKPFSCRLRGSCPTWSKQMNVLVTTVFLAIGFAFLSIMMSLFLNAALR